MDNQNMLGDYRLTKELTSQNSGFSVWGYGVKQGKEFFIKQFLSPKYPENDTVSSPKRLQKRLKLCEDFEYSKRRLYQTLNRCSDGNAVRVHEFFRVGSNYYISTQKITAPSWDIERIAALRDVDKRRLCATIAHAVASFHEGGLVHADLKHTNILFAHGASGIMTAKIIDFDSSFLETNPPQPGEEIIGDQVYFSPEACLHLWGEEVPLTCKMDVFALGVLFHQYFTGRLPEFDRERFCYPGEAVANGDRLILWQGLPQWLSQLLGSMLSPDPNSRPAAAEVFEVLYDGPDGPGHFVGSEEAAKVYSGTYGSTAGGRRWTQAGDL